MKRRIECNLSGAGSHFIFPTKVVRLCGIFLGLSFFTVLFAGAGSTVRAACPVAVSPASAVPERKDSLSMNFLPNGQLRIVYYSYQGNLALNARLEMLQLARLDHFFNVILKDSLLTYGKAEITGTASVDGAYAANEAVAKKRALDFRRFLDTRYKLSDLFPVTINWVGEDWDYLDYCVTQAEPNSPVFRWKEDILRIIRNVPVMGGRETTLMKLGNGVPYQYLKTRFFPLQRRAILNITYDIKTALEKKYKRQMSDSIVKQTAADLFLIPGFVRHVAEKPAVVQTKAVQPDSVKPQPPAPVVAPVVVNHTDTVYIRESPKTKPLPLCFIVKTNLLALSGVTPEPAMRAPMANLEVEWVLNRKWSFSLSTLYASSHSAGNYKRWAVTAYTAECRYRLLPVNKYSGLYAGIYGRGGDFDLQRDNTSVSETDAVVHSYGTGRYYEAGISGGYSYFLTPRWVLEAGMSGGFRHVRRTPYEVGEDVFYSTGSRKSKNRFKLTGLSISIGYVIGKR